MSEELFQFLKNLDVIKCLPVSLLSIIVNYSRESGRLFLGGVTKNYQWDQNRKEVIISIPFPKTVEARKELTVIMKRDYLLVAYKSKQDKPIIEGYLYGPAYMFDENAFSNYLLEQEAGKGVKTMIITLQKILSNPKNLDKKLDLTPYPQFTSGSKSLEDYWPKLFTAGPAWDPNYVPPLCQDFKEAYLDPAGCPDTDTNTESYKAKFDNLFVDEAYFIGIDEKGRDTWRADVSGYLSNRRFVTVARDPYTGKITSTQTRS